MMDEMPPNNPAPTPNDYGFILQNGQKPSRGVGLPKLNLPRPLKIGLVIVFLFFLLILIFGLKGNSTSNSPLTNVGARQTEILRVTKLTANNYQQTTTQNIAISVTSILTSEHQDLAKYLGVKSSDGRFNKYLNKSIDSKLTAAKQDNSYDSTYLTYLKQSLQNYQQLLQTAFGSEPSSAKAMLQADYQDAQTLLNSPQLKGL